ncbi:MAG: helix-turn-helix domain-containing protein [Streptosporangiaceae bacterium]
MDSTRSAAGTALGSPPTGAHLPGDIGITVRSWVKGSQLSASVVARRAGVSGSTLHRVLNDQVDPSIGTLREIAVACGVGLTLDTGPLADAAAAAAARVILEDGYSPSLPDADLWVERLGRQVGYDPVQIVEAAGRASSPLLRAGSRLLAGPVEVGRVASAGEASGGQWALSGLAGFRLPGLWERLPAPTILWCEDVRHVEQLLADADLPRVTRPQRTSLAIVEADSALFTNSFEKDRVRYVAPIQILLDGFAIGGVVADIARREAQSW